MRLAPLALALTLAVPARARADAAAEVLAEVDAALAGTGAARVESDSPVCGTPDALAALPEFRRNREFLCRDSAPLGAWKLRGLRADGGGRVDAFLEIRRFPSPEAAARLKQTAIERFGDEQATGHADGSIDWCFLPVTWTDGLLLALRYGCNVSLRHVKALRRIESALAARATPLGPQGIVGLRGEHSGWTRLLRRDGRRRGVPDAERFTRFARVTGVAAGDVLWLRSAPPRGAGRLGRRVGRLAPDETCVPLVAFEDGWDWWRVKSGATAGWVARRFLEPQAAADCRAE